MRHNHALFMDMALRVAQESSAVRKKVGAVLAKDGSLIEFGYNGTPPGWETNVCEERIYYDESGELLKYLDPKIWTPEILEGFDNLRFYKLKTKECVIHAEINVLLKCAKVGKSTQGAILYQTILPCEKCAASIVAAGIKELYYIGDYMSDTSNTEAGFSTLIKGGVNVVRFDQKAGKLYFDAPSLPQAVNNVSIESSS